MVWEEFSEEVFQKRTFPSEVPAKGKVLFWKTFPSEVPAKNASEDAGKEIAVTSPSRILSLLVCFLSEML